MSDPTNPSQTAVLRQRFESVEAAAVAGLAFAIFAFVPGVASVPEATAFKLADSVPRSQALTTSSSIIYP